MDTNITLMKPERYSSPLNFQEAYDFVDGWAAVNHRGLPGYLNRSGEFHAIRGAQDVMGFYDGRAFVKMSNGKYKLIDENLEYVTDTEFDSVPNYSSLVAAREPPYGGTASALSLL